MLDQILVIVSVTSLVMISPGPDMVLVIRNTLISGRRAGLLTSTGILSANLVHITYSVLGIGLVISQSIVPFSALKYAGAAYLMYLGIMSFRVGAGPLDINQIEGLQQKGSWFLQGFLNNLLNPKGSLFYLGVFTMVITPKTPATVMLLLISTMMFVSTSFWLLFVHVLDRAVMRELIERSRQTVNRVFGGVLLLLGIKVASTRLLPMLSKD